MKKEKSKNTALITGPLLELDLKLPNALQLGDLI